MVDKWNQIRSGIYWKNKISGCIRYKNKGSDTFPKPARAKSIGGCSNIHIVLAHKRTYLVEAGQLSVLQVLGLLEQHKPLQGGHHQGSLQGHQGWLAFHPVVQLSHQRILQLVLELLQSFRTTEHNMLPMLLHSGH